MSKHMLGELGAMLDAYDVVQRAEEQRRRRAENEGLAFLAGFAQLRREVVRPVFEAAGEMLRARGHQVKIDEEEFVFEADGKTREAAIGLRITPAGMEGAAANDSHLRELTFSTRHYNRTVCIANGALPQSGSLAGAAGSYPLAQIDAQLVEDHLLKLVAALVRSAA
jgi:hypothetical protein